MVLRRMASKELFSICVVVFVAANQARAICDLQSPYTISETAPSGTVIFNSTSQGTNVSFTIKGPTEGGADSALLNHLLLVNDNTTFQLINSEVLDLEKFKIRYGADIRSITLSVTCGGITNEVFINVAEVNEFSPIFNNAPYNVTIKESLAVGSLVFALRPSVTDEDVVGTENYIFAIQKYNIIDYDGAGYFSIPASSKGDITLAKEIDFDTMGRHSLTLNLSVSDEAPSSLTARTTYTTLRIHVTDVDDQAPYFVYPDCPPPCPAPPFLSIIRLSYKGPLPIKPEIQGDDPDTLGTPLVYSITSGNQHNLFRIDRVTGAINQVKSVSEAGLPDKEFRLVIEVKKDLNNTKLSSIGILTVKVYEQMTNTSGITPPPIGKSTEDKGSDLMIPLIVLGILFVIVLVLLIIVFVIYRIKQREMAIRPIDDKSEPQTEEEDLHTEGEDYTGKADSNERLVFGNKATLGIMTEDFPDTSGKKGNQLPPLPMRDTATETTEGKKKKKSRRRHKNKEIEIFDGTREYNMGADPEFFDSTDKSKVKRSQRSKKVESSLPIQVPNDNFTDTESVHM